MGLTSSFGNRPARLQSSMMGMRLSSMNLRVVSRTRRPSSVSKESTSRKSTPRNLMAISFSFLFLRRVHVPNGACELFREPGADTQGVETLEGNKGCEGSQTDLGGTVAGGSCGKGEQRELRRPTGGPGNPRVFKPFSRSKQPLRRAGA